MEHATNAAASVGIMQYGLSIPAEINPSLQTLFFVVSIIWVVTQTYYKLFKKDK